MTIKARFNPSTGKVAYNPDTGKVQVFDFIQFPVGDDCQFCDPGTTPKFVKVTFSDIEIMTTGVCVDCPATPLPNDTRDAKLFGTSYDPNGEHTLTQYGAGNFGSCGWSLIVDVDMYIEKYNSFDGSCSGGVWTTINLNTVHFWFYLRTIGPTVFSTLLCAANGINVNSGFYFRALNTGVPSGLGCVDWSFINSRQAETPGCSISSGQAPLGNGGTAVVEALLSE